MVVIVMITIIVVPIVVVSIIVVIGIVRVVAIGSIVAAIAVAICVAICAAIPIVRSVATIVWAIWVFIAKVPVVVTMAWFPTWVASSGSVIVGVITALRVVTGSGAAIRISISIPALTLSFVAIRAVVIGMITFLILFMSKVRVSFFILHVLNYICKSIIHNSPPSTRVGLLPGNWE